MSVAVQIRGVSGEVFAREVCRDRETALRVAMCWVSLLIEDLEDPLDALEYIPAIEIVPDDRYRRSGPRSPSTWYAMCASPLFAYRVSPSTDASVGPLHAS